MREQKIKIDGPGILAVGAQGEFTATLESGASPGNELEWEVDENYATLSPKTGPKVTVIPLKLGSFELTARTTSVASPPDEPAEGKVSVTAVASQPTAEELPFIGQGWGSLLIAVLVIIAVITLGVTGVLTGEAVATLFGGLLGYIFGVTTAGGGQPPKKTNGQTQGQ